MAAPQTHFVVIWVVYRILTWVVGIHLYTIEALAIFFFGVGIDIDHFSSREFARDIFKVRITRFLKGGDVGKPSEGIRDPFPWFHSVLLLFVVIPTGFLFWLRVKSVFVALIPVGFWLIHIIVDKFQASEGIAYFSFFWPFVSKKKIRKGGYPIKSREEVLVATIISAIIILFEAIRALMGFVL